MRGKKADSGDTSDYDSSSYHDSGNFTDSSLSESRSATFTANDLKLAGNGFSESNTATQNSDGGDDVTLFTDSSNGSYTSISQSHSASIGDRSHETGGESEVNGAVTSADENYTEDDIAKTNELRSETDTLALGFGMNETSSESGGVSVSSSFHDGGHHDVTAGTTTDTGADKDFKHEEPDRSPDRTGIYQGDSHAAFCSSWRAATARRAKQSARAIARELDLDRPRRTAHSSTPKTWTDGCVSLTLRRICRSNVSGLV